MFSDHENPETLARFVDWVRIELAIERPGLEPDIEQLAKRFADTYQDASRVAVAESLKEWFRSQLRGEWRRRWENLAGKRGLGLPSELRAPRAFLAFLAKRRMNAAFLYEAHHENFARLVRERRAYFNRRSGYYLNVFDTATFIKRIGGAELRESLLRKGHDAELPALALWCDTVEEAEAVSLRLLNEEQILTLFDMTVGSIREELDFGAVMSVVANHVQNLREESRMRFVFNSTISGERATVFQGVENVVITNQQDIKLADEARSVIRSLAKSNPTGLDAMLQKEFSRHLSEIADAQNDEQLDRARSGWLRWLKFSGGGALHVAAISSDVVTLAGATGIAGLGSAILNFLHLL